MNKQQQIASLIDDIPKCIVSGEKGKFVIIRVAGCNGREWFFFQSDSKEESHSGIVKKFLAEWISGFCFSNNGLQIACLGGGRIIICKKQKTITITGESGDFSIEPDRSLTIAMLQKQFPNFKISEIQDEDEL